MAIEGITGLKINYWAMVNLEGFKDLVDAVGGVTLNVRQPIPVGGLGDDVTGYIEPGMRKLDGHDTLWFARARDDSDDYSRMARQKCVMSAMLQQVSPQTARDATSRRSPTAQLGDDLHQHPARARSTGSSQLALKARSQKISTALAGAADDQHRPPRHPDWSSEGRRGDRQAEGRTPTKPADAEPETSRRPRTDVRGDAATPATTTSGRRRAAPQPEVVTGGSVGSLTDGYAANESDDLGAAC